MYTRYKLRDWDYLGYRYSFISSIATGGWNNVVDMIPARNSEEAKAFSAEDKAWIRDWLAWTVKNKEYLRHTRTILQQPALGHVDGTAAILGDRGHLFLFNPNYKQLPAEITLDESIGLTKGDKYLIREIYPQDCLLYTSFQRRIPFRQPGARQLHRIDSRARILACFGIVQSGYRSNPRRSAGSGR